MASYLQHTFTFQNLCTFSNLLNIIFLIKAELLRDMYILDSSLYSIGNIAHRTAICTSGVYNELFC